MEPKLVISVVISLVGGLGIFLLGMKNMSEGLQAVAGPRLRKMIGYATENRFLAVLVGIGVTCTVQSSSITTVMVIGLVNSSFMTLKQAIGVILGANIGTTITGWILALNIGKYGLPILGLSSFLYLFTRNERLRYTGMALMGIGMIFFGLQLMSEGLRPLRAEPAFLQWFEAFQADSYLGVLKCAAVGCVLTFIVQSSSATLGITMSLAATGVIGFETAAALVMGENLGTTITAYLASLGANTTARRAAYAHIIFNAIGVVVITAIFPFYIRFIEWISHHDANFMKMVDGEPHFPFIMAAIALSHTCFNVINTLIWLPFLGVLSAIVSRLAPDRGVKEVPHLTHLDVRMLNTPSLGIAQSRKEVVFMSERLLKMMGALRQTLADDGRNEERERDLFHDEEVLDNVQKEITVFLGSLLTGQIPHDVMIESRHQLRIADELESASDYVTNILKMYIKLRKNELSFTDEGRADMLDLHDRATRFVGLIHEAVLHDSPAGITRIFSQGDEITHIAKQYRKRHLERLSRLNIHPFNSLMFTDMLNAYRRIKDHGINIAEAISGEK